MKENIIQQKSYAFAIKIINLYKYLVETKKEFILSKQLLRSGTSIGANIEEALGGQSKKDFISKLSIAYKEARETKYWLSLIREAKYMKQEELSLIFDDCEEILRIIGKIQKTSKEGDLI
ncbi:MAG: four helix bundle protein [Candidatus Paceibacterota bacterium]